MIERAVEFLRIADTQASDDKVRRRIESATDLVSLIDVASNQKVLLAMVQGVVNGFDKSPFDQDSPAIALVIKAIKEKDTTLPADLTENAVELRAVAAIAVGELLVRHSQSESKGAALLVALSLRSALSLRPTGTAKHIRLMLEALLTASDGVLSTLGSSRRKRDNAALEHLLNIEESTESTDLWEIVVPAIRAAVQEVSAQAAIDREEIEMLWWMFTAYSEIEKKSLADLSSLEAAFCSGLELAKRALLPPTSNASEMVKKVVISGRKASTLVSVSLEEFVKAWSRPMLNSLLSLDSSSVETIEYIPSLLPLSWASRHANVTGEFPQLGTDFVAATGLSLNLSHGPADWGAQIFREAILRRVLAETRES